jgi:AraC family transcriptional regulator
MDARVRTVLDYIRTNVRSDLTLSGLAESVHLSVPYFCKLFKAATGTSPGQYLIKFRLEKTRELLASTHLPVKWVMAQAGFKDKSNFVRHFRRAYGVTPTEYRSRLRRAQPGELRERRRRAYSRAR